MGLSFVIDDSQDDVIYLHFDDNFNGITSEGIYYFTLHVSQKSNDIDATLPEFICPHDAYGRF